MYLMYSMYLIGLSNMFVVDCGFEDDGCGINVEGDVEDVVGANDSCGSVGTVVVIVAVDDDDVDADDKDIKLF